MMLPRRALGVLAFAFLGSAANAAAAPISVTYIGSFDELGVGRSC